MTSAVNAGSCIGHLPVANSNGSQLQSVGQTRASLVRGQVAEVSPQKRDLCSFAEVPLRASITLEGIDGDSTGTRHQIRAQGR